MQVVWPAGGGEAAEGGEEQARELRPEPPQGQGVPPGTLRSPFFCDTTELFHGLTCHVLTFNPDCNLILKLLFLFTENFTETSSQAECTMMIFLFNFYILYIC